MLNGLKKVDTSLNKTNKQATLIFLVTFKKSRSLVIKSKGKKKSEKEQFRSSGKYITTIKEKPIKKSRKLVDQSPKGAEAIQETKEIYELWLNRVHKSGWHVRFKSRIYLHTILSKILWPSFIYEFTTFLT